MENTRDTINCPKCAVTLDITDYPLGAVIINCFLCNHDFCRECNHELDQELLDGTCPIDMPLAADDSYQSRLRMNNVMTDLNETPKNKRGRPKKNPNYGGARPGAGRPKKTRAQHGGARPNSGRKRKNPFNETQAAVQLCDSPLVAHNSITVELKSQKKDRFCYEDEEKHSVTPIPGVDISSWALDFE